MRGQAEEDLGGARPKDITFPDVICRGLSQIQDILPYRKKRIEGKTKTQTFAKTEPPKGHRDAHGQTSPPRERNRKRRHGKLHIQIKKTRNERDREKNMTHLEET